MAKLKARRVTDASKSLFQFRPYVKLCQKYRYVLDEIRRVLGYGWISGNENNGYRWFVNAKDNVDDFIGRISPYSIVKREALSVLAEFIAFQRTLSTTAPYTEADLKGMLDIRDKLLNLNEMTRGKQLPRIVHTRSEILGTGFFVKDKAAQEFFTAKRANNLPRIRNKLGGSRFG